jgi:predicted nucleotidyltransferase component of viral defense system
MLADYLHNHPQFAELIRIVVQERGIDPALVEKDYWIMHCLYGLQKLNMKFQLKGGTSLSKGHKIIGRFSEDIDILIEPPPVRQVATRKSQTSAAQVKSRKDFYDWLATTIKINGITKVARDTAYDNADYFSGGIRLSYKSINKLPARVSEGVLLELGFDDVSPNEPKDISSWAYDHAVAKKVEIVDNRAKGVACYDPRYTFVEKLQTISTKFRLQQEKGTSPVDFMRHYYDVHELLGRAEIQAFIGTEAYKTHKTKRFRKADNQNIAENQAFIISDPATRKLYEKAYQDSSALYYGSKPAFAEILAEIGKYINRL